MFGYLVAATKVLENEDLARYKSVYCGLCRSLSRCFGQTARLTLNFDMTFLVLLLGSLYEPEEERGDQTCVRHPIEAHPYAMSELTDYAAHMNIAMAYLKCLDDWKDDRRVTAWAEARTLKAGYETVKAKYPRQCGAIEQALGELSALEDAGREDPDAAAACFGAMMREIFVYKEDRWAESLRSMADALGRFVYLLDAAIDLEDDVSHGSYNPFRSLAGDADNGERFRDILRMQLGECIFWFDRLPLVQDVNLLKNILCVGLWAAFNQKYMGEDPKDGSGPV
jgi:hypothetical protein